MIVDEKPKYNEESSRWSEKYFWKERKDIGEWSSVTELLKIIDKGDFRLHSPVPLLVGRESITKCKIDDYKILPKTRVLVNAWAIGRDPESWEKPEEFLP